MNNQDARAQRLLQVGLDVAVRIRDEGPNDVAHALAGLTRTDLRDLAVLLAACVPIDQPCSKLLAWRDPPPPKTRKKPAPRQNLMPCGTVAAARRHRARGEDVDQACLTAIRDYDRDRTRQRRAAA